ncbi:MAG: DUF1553 domain-containing protein [Planctomycetes bacterium]|nr:DUF1553 domain-containing protein [Planctomycetota bacterium]
MKKPCWRSAARLNTRRASAVTQAGLVALLLLGLTGPQPAAAADAAPVRSRKIDFLRDIRPILSNHCWSCHGPDELNRKGGLRLDVAESTQAKLESGAIAIVPGKPADSELIERIETTDPTIVMPPPASKKPLTADQKRLLSQWIEQGAPFAQHWAFVPVQRPAVPRVRQPNWPKNPIDDFVLSRLEAEGLAPSAEASRATLLRRVTLDLTGVPPTIAELETFLGDTSPEAYEKVVDRLLASSRFGEKFATQWLDAARYADTNGYNNDEERSMWPWRDWVIRAFNENKPFDQFLIEQLAGDLLPNPTLEQRVATGFNRNHVLTTEGGIIDEEYRVEYVADRVHTTATVVMGLSMQCARCHEHKYDPLTQRDYYQFFSFFNNVADKTVNYNQGGAAEPFLKAPTADQQRELTRLTDERQAAEARIAGRKTAVDADIVRWEQGLSPEQKAELSRTSETLRVPFDQSEGSQVAVSAGQGPVEANAGQVQGPADWKPGKSGQALSFAGQTVVELGERGAFDRTSTVSISVWVFPTANEAGAILSKMDDAQAFRGFDLLLEGGRPAVHLVHHWPDNGLKVLGKHPMSLNAWHHVLVTYDGSSKAAGLAIYIDGQAQDLEISSDKLSDTIKTEQPLRIGRRSASIPFRGLIDDVRFLATRLQADDARRLVAGTDPAGLGDILALPVASRSPEQKEALRRFYLETLDAEYRKATVEVAELNRRLQEIDKTVPRTMVMAEIATPRQAHILIRGQYDKPGEPVEAAVPTVLSEFPAGAPRNRLGLALWLTQPAHPLTSRVAVNRFWSTLFGAGLVETVEDFGIQGELPSHPELLNWLAAEFMSGGHGPGDKMAWDVKALVRLIVTSATYRQTSDASDQLLERDPRNRLLARGPRFRLPAESVRDCALAISGLLHERPGGPSVKPYQPDGLWEEVSVERRYKYVPDKNEGLYRRSMYTFWKRTCPPPGMTAFDAPDRETCLVRRARTNTPLQALVLLNDPTYVESSRRFAERVLKQGGTSVSERLDYAFRLALSRPATEAERPVLLKLLAETRTRFEQVPADAEKLISVGESSRDKSLPAVDLATWTTVCSILLNLDESITKE